MLRHKIQESGNTRLKRLREEGNYNQKRGLKVNVAFKNIILKIKTSWSHCNKLCVGMIISRSSALSVNVLLISDMHEVNGTLFLKVRILFLSLASLVPSIIIVYFAEVALLKTKGCQKN